VEIQALDRTQPGLPMKKGRGQTMTHDYKRNGTTTLFAALNTATGEIYHLCQQRHRHHEWLKFLRMIDQTVSAEKQIHIICDNYGTHKHERVQRWMARHKRFHVHFTPTSASWLIDRCINNAIVQRKEKDNSDWTMQPRSFS
jgi:transposase